MSDTDSDGGVLKAVADAAVVAPASGGAGTRLPPDDSGFDDGEPERADLSDDDWALLRLCVKEGTHDIANARRLRHRYQGDLVHIQNVAWHVYDGTRWIEDVDGVHLTPITHKTVEAIALETLLIQPDEHEAALIEAAEMALTEKNGMGGELTPEQKSLLLVLNGKIASGSRARKAVSGRKAARRRFANASCNTGKIEGMLAQARGYLSKPMDAFDADPLALNVSNGTLRFTLGETEDYDCPDPDITRMKPDVAVTLSPHVRGDQITKMADVIFDPDATCPLFDKFYERILPDPVTRAYLMRYFGYGLTALTREQVFVLLHGEGRNGKSTLVDIISKIMSDYSTSVPIATLTGEDRRKGAEATPDLVRIPSARLVRSAEPKEGMPFDESLIKSLTSGEPILVRRLNQEFIEVYPRFKLVISANRKPVIKGNDDGIWRRVVLVPFDEQIPEHEVDKNLTEKLWMERSGILNRLIEGLCDYLTRGALDPPDAIRAATQGYRDDSDVMGAFVREALEVTRHEADAEQAGALFDAFLVWCQRSSRTPFKRDTFSRRMPATAQKFGMVKGKASSSIYTGVRVRAEFLPSEDEKKGGHGHRAYPSRTHDDGFTGG